MIANLARKKNEREARSTWFYRWLILILLSVSGLLLYELRTIWLPILVGAILAYLFRPLKNALHVRWLPHEARVFIAFGIAGLLVTAAIIKVKELIPDEKQKLELRVRLKYKLNERYRQFFASANPVVAQVQKEVTPVMAQINDWLTLSDAEQDLFKKYRRGYHGESPISDRYYDYFKQTLSQSAIADLPELPATSDVKDAPKDQGPGWLESLSLWVLTPLIFLFLIFDNGQIRLFTIGLVPNRYFEMALTMVDELDDAIGKYLRGTSLECALVGMTMGVGLALLGFPLSVAIFVAVISGIANAIPFLGPAIGLVISLAYALIAEDTVPLLPWLSPDSLPLYVAVLVAVTHVLDNILYSPVVLGGAVNLHPMVVIVAITGGSILMGFWGMLFAIPTVVVCKTGLETLVKELRAYRII